MVTFPDFLSLLKLYYYVGAHGKESPSESIAVVTLLNWTELSYGNGERESPHCSVSALFTLPLLLMSWGRREADWLPAPEVQ
jgi:hypothetical protein